MPAGDAGLEPGPETACRAYPVEAEEALNARMASKVLDEIWVSPAGWWYAAWMHRQSEVDRLQAQLAAQQAVIDAARHLANSNSPIPGATELSLIGTSLIYEIRSVLAALDKAQAVQPEGEQAR